MGQKISYNSKAQEISIQRNFLTELPKTILSQTHTGVRSVIASSNFLSDLPRLHTILPHVSSLILSHNRFTTIPTSLANLESLQKLV